MLDPLLELYIFWMGIFAPIGIIVILLAWVIWWLKLTPKQVKRLRYCLTKKIPPLATAFDDGHCEILPATEVMPEGIIKSKIGKNPELIFALPRPYDNGKENTEPNPLNVLLTRRFTMDGVPFFVGYVGKAVLTNIKTLANLEHAGIETLGNPGGSERKLEINGKEHSVFFPVDMRTLKTAISKSWNQAQIRALEVKAELSGMLRGKKYFGGAIKQWMPFFIIALLIIAIIVLAAILL